MRTRSIFAIGLLILSAWGTMRAQKPFQQYPAIEYEDFALPKDWNTPAEWTRARLRYPDITGYPNHSFYRDFSGYWTMDYPRSDRHLLAGVRRLTRIDARSVEQHVIAEQVGMHRPARQGVMAMPGLKGEFIA